MPADQADLRLRIALLFTRYPVLSERFLLREVEELRRQKQRVQVHSLWFGGDRVEDATPASSHFGPLQLLSLIFWIPYWVILRPQAMLQLARALTGEGPRSALNVWENLLGMGYGLVRARRLRQQSDHLHAVWASAPAAAAWTVHLLTGLPFSMAGHAYDLFEYGGDWLIRQKLASARFVRTSTGCGRDRLLRLGADPGRVVLIRRGTSIEQPLVALRPAGSKLRLLSVGRLVEKMGNEYQLELAARLAASGRDFHLLIIGDGPQRAELEDRVRVLGLKERVEFAGAQPHERVQSAYREADALLFTGCVAASGDRAGFPNAVGEAMAVGLPVFATPVGAVTEAIQHEQTGWVLSGNAEEDTRLILSRLANAAEVECTRDAAFAWVRGHFDLSTNVSRLVHCFDEFHA